MHLLFNYCYHCRLPSRIQTEKRQKWINVISEHRPKFDPETEYFYICFKHFSEGQLKKNAKNLALKDDAVPDIFETEEIDVLPWTEEMENNFQPGQTEETDIEKIKTQLMQAKLAHEIEKQNLEQKLIALKKSKKDIQIKLQDEKKINSKLAEIVENIQKKFKGCTPQVSYSFMLKLLTCIHL